MKIIPYTAMMSVYKIIATPINLQVFTRKSRKPKIVAFQVFRFLKKPRFFKMGLDRPRSRSELVSSLETS